MNVEGNPFVRKLELGIAIFHICANNASVRKKIGGDGKITPLLKEDPADHQTYNLKGWDAQYEHSPLDARENRPGIAKQQSDDREESEG